MNKGLVLLFFFFCIIGQFLFWSGLHNLDLAQNWRFVNAEYDLNLNEHYLNGESVELTDLYGMGVFRVIFGFYWSMVSFLLLGFNFEKVKK